MAGKIKPERHESINSKLKKLTSIFTPGHAGVKGNKRANKVAGSAATMENHRWNEANLLCEIWLRNESTATDSETVQRLKELGIQRGDGCKSTCRSTARYRINQMMTGTISLVTLRWLLKRLTEQLWTCPACNDVYR